MAMNFNSIMCYCNRSIYGKMFYKGENKYSMIEFKLYINVKISLYANEIGIYALNGKY